jgi:hypothetical protein
MCVISLCTRGALDAWSRGRSTAAFGVRVRLTMFNGRVHLPLALLLGLSIGNTSFAACRLMAGWIQNYEGDIGGRRVRLSIAESGGALEGVYVYADDLTDRALAPRQTDVDSIVIDELDAGGGVAARFVGRFETQDPKGKFGTSELQCEVITGSWSRLESADNKQFYLQAESATAGSLHQRYRVAGVLDDVVVNENAATLWTAFRDNDRATVARLVAYPFSKRFDGRMIEFRTPEQLLPYMDYLFQPEVREGVLRVIPRHMFVNWRGIYFGPFTLDTNGHVVVY